MGRKRLNEKLRLNIPLQCTTLTSLDFLAVFYKLFSFHLMMNFEFPLNQTGLSFLPNTEKKNLAKREGSLTLNSLAKKVINTGAEASKEDKIFNKQWVGNTALDHLNQRHIRTSGEFLFLQFWRGTLRFYQLLVHISSRTNFVRPPYSEEIENYLNYFPTGHKKSTIKFDPVEFKESKFFSPGGKKKKKTNKSKKNISLPNYTITFDGLPIIINFFSPGKEKKKNLITQRDILYLLGSKENPSIIKKNNLESNSYLMLKKTRWQKSWSPHPTYFFIRDKKRLESEIFNNQNFDNFFCSVVSNSQANWTREEVVAKSRFRHRPLRMQSTEKQQKTTNRDIFSKILPLRKPKKVAAGPYYFSPLKFSYFDKLNWNELDSLLSFFPKNFKFFHLDPENKKIDDNQRFGEILFNDTNLHSFSSNNIIPLTSSPMKKKILIRPYQKSLLKKTIVNRGDKSNVSSQLFSKLPRISAIKKSLDRFESPYSNRIIRFNTMTRSTKKFILKLSPFFHIPPLVNLTKNQNQNMESSNFSNFFYGSETFFYFFFPVFFFPTPHSKGIRKNWGKKNKKILYRYGPIISFIAYNLYKSSFRLTLVLSGKESYLPTFFFYRFLKKNIYQLSKSPAGSENTMKSESPLKSVKNQDGEEIITFISPIFRSGLRVKRFQIQKKLFSVAQSYLIQRFLKKILKSISPKYKDKLAKSKECEKNSYPILFANKQSFLNKINKNGRSSGRLPLQFENGEKTNSSPTKSIEHNTFTKLSKIDQPDGGQLPRVWTAKALRHFFKSRVSSRNLYGAEIFDVKRKNVLKKTFFLNPLLISKNFKTVGFSSYLSSSRVQLRRTRKNSIKFSTVLTGLITKEKYQLKNKFLTTEKRYGLEDNWIKRLKNERQETKKKLLISPSLSNLQTKLISLEQLNTQEQEQFFLKNNFFYKGFRQIFLSFQELEKFEAIERFGNLETKLFNGIFKEFFNLDPLSQQVDETNGLSEIIHKRKISALGLGGVTVRNAPLSIRSIHPSFYGRLCPIDSPEGDRVGLINSLTNYARITSIGNVGTPFYQTRFPSLFSMDSTMKNQSDTLFSSSSVINMKICPPSVFFGKTYNFHPLFRKKKQTFYFLYTPSRRPFLFFQAYWTRLKIFSYPVGYKFFANTHSYLSKKTFRNDLPKFYDSHYMISSISYREVVPSTMVSNFQINHTKTFAKFKGNHLIKTSFSNLYKNPKKSNESILNAFAGNVMKSQPVFGKSTDVVSGTTDNENFIDLKSNTALVYQNNQWKHDEKINLTIMLKSSKFLTCYFDFISLQGYIPLNSFQFFSPGVGLIPFLEHDDGTRALMGANMQRQAVPLIDPERPIVGTGLEKNIAASFIIPSNYSSYLYYITGKQSKQIYSQPSRPSFFSIFFSSHGSAAIYKLHVTRIFVKKRKNGGTKKKKWTL